MILVTISKNDKTGKTTIDLENRKDSSLVQFETFDGHEKEIINTL